MTVVARADLRAPSRRRRAAALALVLLTAAAFLPVLGGGFLNLDDPFYVTRNPRVLGGLSLDGLRWALVSFDSSNWHPLTWVSHMADVSLFGQRPGAHHGTSLALHALAAVLLMLALEGMTGALPPSFLAAALFAVHPLRVESVAWISERKDVLSLLLGVVALLLYLRYARRPATARYLAVCSAFALALMAKPMLVTLPFVLLLLDWWPLGRFSRLPAAATRAAVARRLALEKLPLLALSAASSTLTYLAQRQGGALVSADVFPFAARAANALASYAAYLAKMLWPHQLVAFYPHLGPVLSPGEIALLLAFLGGVTAAAVAHRARRPWLLAGWLWYLGTLVPVIGLVQVGLQGMADRYTYLPGIGPILALVWEARLWSTARPRDRAALRGAAAAILAILALFTWRQAAWWRDSVTLFTRTISIDPRNYFAINMLGAEYFLRSDTARAGDLFARALQIRPEYAVARYNLALALAAAGRDAEAIAQYDAIIRHSPGDGESLLNRGRLLLKAGNAESALRDFEAALAVKPGQPQILAARDRALAELGWNAGADRSRGAPGGRQDR